MLNINAAFLISPAQLKLQITLLIFLYNHLKILKRVVFFYLVQLNQRDKLTEL